MALPAAPAAPLQLVCHQNLFLVICEQLCCSFQQTTTNIYIYCKPQRIYTVVYMLLSRAHPVTQTKYSTYYEQSYFV